MIKKHYYNTKLPQKGCKCRLCINSLKCGHNIISARCMNCLKCIYCGDNHILTTNFDKHKTIIVCKNL